MLSALTDELTSIWKNRLIWLTLSLLDIKIKYRRSSLGPFWLTLSMAVTIYSMGFLYGHLFHLNLQDYFPYLASGIICWTLISTLIIDSNQAFIESSTYIKNQPFNMSTFLMKIICRNFIIFAHNLVAYIPIMLMFKVGLDINFLFIFPGLLLICINAYFWGGILATLGTRFGDFDQIIKSVMQVVFFVTPVMWMPSLLPERVLWIVYLNPFAHFLQVIRNPLVGQAVSMTSLLCVLVMSAIGIITFCLLSKRARYRIVYWL